ncbi:hypothetical protein SLS62_011383 [Diatrype stigma]|uniref:Sugar phosphate transporter domain-containing protein n=1 Tax=Diatrype stigma TaxID=117547 RepID=A0AAN9U6G8_9PEZI
MPSPLSNNPRSSRTSSPSTTTFAAASASTPTSASQPPLSASRQGKPAPFSNKHKLSLAVPPRAPSGLSTRTSATTTPTQLVNTVLVAPSSTTSFDYSAPSSATSATTSFRKDRIADAGGGLSSTSAPDRRSEDIEMDPIAPAGHRRRRSTLTFSQNNTDLSDQSQAPSASSSRPPHRRSHSARHQAREGGPKISEEDLGGVLSKEGPSDDSLSDEDLHDDEETGLTRKDRKRKQSKRRRNTRLDQRIARDKLSDEERKQADKNVIRRLVVNGVLIGLCPTWRLVAVIATMTGGVVMMVAGEVEFQLSGFILVISAAFFSGFRWGLTQILLLRNPATSNPFSSIFFLAPVMFFTLTLIAVPVEGFFPLLEGLRILSDAWGPWKTPLILLFPGCIAFLMTASEFALLKRSSVVTLSIAGIFKEVLTIAVAALVFDDRLTPINISGLIITLIAIGGYNWIKLSKMRNEAQMDVHNKAAYQQPQSESSSDDRGSSSDSEEEEAGLLAHKDDVYENEPDNNLSAAEGGFLPRPLSSNSAEDSRSQHRTEHP